MGVFDLRESAERAARRLGTGPGARRPRSDRGRSRLAPEVQARLEELLLRLDRLPVRAIVEALRDFCAPRGLRPPSRATIYESMARVTAGSYDLGDLPAAAREALYNLEGTAEVPGHQLAFYCLNYGDLRAVSFAAGLPWLALYQAARLPGWRPRSRGLLDAILLARGIR